MNKNKLNKAETQHLRHCCFPYPPKCSVTATARDPQAAVHTRSWTTLCSTGAARPQTAAEEGRLAVGDGLLHRPPQPCFPLVSSQLLQPHSHSPAQSGNRGLQKKHAEGAAGKPRPWGRGECSGVWGLLGLGQNGTQSVAWGEAA